MRKTKSKTIIALVGLMLVLSGCSEEKSNKAYEEGETIKLRAATGLSAQHAWWANSMVPWMERVEELTDGQVEFETFTGGELVAVPDEADAVLDGTVDVALVLPIYEPDQYPMAEVTMLPLSHSDTLIASNAWKKLLESDEVLADGKTYAECNLPILKYSQFQLLRNIPFQQQEKNLMRQVMLKVLHFVHLLGFMKSTQEKRNQQCYYASS